MSIEAPPAPVAEAPPAAPVTPQNQAPAATPPPVANPPAAPTPTPAPPAISPDGKLGENWFLALGDEFAPHAADLAKHKDLRSLLTERDYFRKNGVEYPKDDAPQAAIDRFRSIAGVPETPEGYGLTAEAMKLPDGMQFDSELAGEISAAAHKFHAPPQAVLAMADVFNKVVEKRTADALKAQADAAAATKDALVKEWRNDFATNASTVRHITSTLAAQAGISPEDPAIAGFMQDISSMPALSKIMLQVARLTSEDKITVPNGFGSLQSPAQQLEAINNGTDPVWSPKANSTSEADRTALYEHKKALRAQMTK